MCIMDNFQAFNLYVSENFHLNILTHNCLSGESEEINNSKINNLNFSLNFPDRKALFNKMVL